MTLRVNAAAEACGTVARQVRERFRNLTLHYITHHDGQRTEALGLAVQEVLGHPGAETARHLLTNAGLEEDASLIGVAVARENLFLGLATRDSLLALASINIDRHGTLKDCRSHAYHLAWHAIDAHGYHADPRHRRGFPGEVIVRRRNGVELAAANLRADTFAVMMGGLLGDGDMLHQIGLRRAQAALEARAGHQPERYPFLIALESAGVGLKELRRQSLPRRRHFDAALRIAGQVGQIFDEDAIAAWLGFAESAQDMAWRGFTPDQILSAAISTSENIHIRDLGYMVSELTGVTPARVAENGDFYSPFADDDFNRRLHEKSAAACFRDVMAEGLRQGSALPFTDTARRQNARLLDVQVIGWCAGALQAAGRAFTLALESGREPEAAARREFESEQARTPWASLRDLGRKLVETYRAGQALGLRDLAAMNKDDAQLASLRKSLDVSLKDAGPHGPSRAATPAAAAAFHPARTPAPAFLARPGFEPGGGPSFPASPAPEKVTRAIPASGRAPRAAQPADDDGLHIHATFDLVADTTDDPPP